MNETEERCTAMSATGVRCQLEHGHRGAHFAQTGAAAHVWTTREQAPAPGQGPPGSPG